MFSASAKHTTLNSTVTSHVPGLTAGDENMARAFKALAENYTTMLPTTWAFHTLMDLS